MMFICEIAWQLFSTFIMSVLIHCENCAFLMFMKAFYNIFLPASS
jgi:hypothetical protein